MPSDDQALFAINSVKDQMAGLARAIVMALDDGKVSVMEGINMGFRGMSLAQFVISVLQSMSDEDRKHVLWLLEHGQFAPPK